MAKHYDQFQPKQKEVKFHHQKKCGHCKETFTFKDGNRQYCNNCQKKLKIPEWDSENKTAISRQANLTEEEKEEALIRGDLT